MQGRTHNCGQLRLENVGEEVKLVGWYENLRQVSKNLGFLILRDFYGTTQIVAETEEQMEQLAGINYESTIEIVGIVRERSSKNSKIPTGDIEVVPSKITVLGKCQYNELPFQINHSKDADENVRLKYRYLDLRNPDVKSRIILRSRIVADLRAAMIGHDFMEITTPILTCSSPEGARDYLVPARNHPGKFYALPQAPQQFKQLLMASGFDRYFQIAPCFRDEDARADRSPGEFYQLDMEMAFANQEDVFEILEDVLPPIFARYGIYNEASKPPFKRIPYLEAMDKYGSDKPDLRISLIVQDATDVLADCGFGPFAGNKVKAVVAENFTGTRKQIDKLCADIEVVSGQKAYYFRLDENGELVGGIAKFVQEHKETVVKALGLKNGDFVALAAGDLKTAQKTAGVIRKTIGNSFETMNPLDILAYQYDLVCNGVELSSGAVRNHDPEIMIKAFKLVGLGEDDVKAKFPAMYNAFCYGAPPHAGIAPGVDRMVMLIAGEESIREIIPFPMNKNAQDVMMGAPATVTEKQLREVHIQIVEDKAEEKKDDAQ